MSTPSPLGGTYATFFLRLPAPNFFPNLFLSFLSAPLFLLPLAFQILAGCHKKFGVNYGQEKMSAKLGNGTLINHRYNGPFTTIFAPKLITFRSVCYFKSVPFYNSLWRDDQKWSRCNLGIISGPGDHTRKA